MSIVKKNELSSRIEYLLWEAIYGDSSLSQPPQTRWEQLIRDRIDGRNPSLVTVDKCTSRIERVQLAITNGISDYFEYPQSRIEELLIAIHTKQITGDESNYHFLTDESGDFLLTEDDDFILLYIGSSGNYDAISRIERLLKQILDEKIWH